MGNRLIRAIAAALALAIASAATATAGADMQTFHLTPAGEAAAGAAVLTKADMPAWTAGATRKVIQRQPRCADASYHPRQSDLVVNGDVETVFTRAGFEYDSNAQVFQTPAMVERDWQRSFAAPGLLACLRSESQAKNSSTIRLVSVKRIPFERVATHTDAYRFVYDYGNVGKATRVAVDVVFVIQGRTEIRLTSAARLSSASQLAQGEQRLARTLAGRISS
jgi:hypothetical protein